MANVQLSTLIPGGPQWLEVRSAASSDLLDEVTELVDALTDVVGGLT